MKARTEQRQSKESSQEKKVGAKRVDTQIIEIFFSLFLSE